MLVLSLGSNLGNRYAYLQQAISAIGKTFQTKINVSKFYVTPPWGETQQAQFINIAVLLKTDLDPTQCLLELQSIESKLGRIKTYKWGPRVIDIDILFYGEESIVIEDLYLPHPRAHERAFVLAPVCDLIPNFVHPTKKMTMLSLLNSIENNTKIFEI